MILISFLYLIFHFKVMLPFVTSCVLTEILEQLVIQSKKQWHSHEVWSVSAFFLYGFDCLSILKIVESCDMCSRSLSHVRYSWIFVVLLLIPVFFYYHLLFGSRFLDKGPLHCTCFSLYLIRHYTIYVKVKLEVQ